MTLVSIEIDCYNQIRILELL